MEKRAEGGTNQPMSDPSASITRCPRAGAPVPGCPPVTGACTTVARALAARATVPPSRYPPGDRPSPGAAPSWRGGHRPVSTRGSGPGIKPGPAPYDLTWRPEWRVHACGAGRQASLPRRPATRPAASTPGNGGAAPSVTARDPAPVRPLRQGRAVRQTPPSHTGRPCGPCSFPVSPQPRAAVRCRRPGGGRT